MHSGSGTRFVVPFVLGTLFGALGGATVGALLGDRLLTVVVHLVSLLSHHDGDELRFDLLAQ
ncbi:MAG TPA: hypothetical protein VFN57_00955 [Thermomicrobiaceae bacterium]|nr:hypothetical protein [Thermomicrobiaceae bacterium]